MAGQGFNLSLRDAVALIETIRTAVQNGKGIGRLDVLQDYVAVRENDQYQTIGFSDKVVRLFSNNSSALAVMRNAGLAGLDLLFPIKDLFARQAMGLGVGRGYSHNAKLKEDADMTRHFDIIVPARGRPARPWLWLTLRKLSILKLPLLMPMRSILNPGAGTECFRCHSLCPDRGLPQPAEQSRSVVMDRGAARLPIPGWKSGMLTALVVLLFQRPKLATLPRPYR